MSGNSISYGDLVGQKLVYRQLGAWKKTGVLKNVEAGGGTVRFVIGDVKYDGLLGPTRGEDIVWESHESGFKVTRGSTSVTISAGPTSIAIALPEGKHNPLFG